MPDHVEVGDGVPLRVPVWLRVFVGVQGTVSECEVERVDTVGVGGDGLGVNDFRDSEKV